jgi:hypothetical protein
MNEKCRVALTTVLLLTGCATGGADALVNAGFERQGVAEIEARLIELAGQS